MSIIDMRDGGTPLFKDRLVLFVKIVLVSEIILAHLNTNLRSRRKSYEVVLHSARRASHYVVEYLSHWSSLAQNCIFFSLKHIFLMGYCTDVTLGNLKLSSQQITRDDLK